MVIEEAAERLFAERGYSATRLEDVAAAAGISKQLLHRHFRSKLDLHLVLLAKHRDGVVAQITAGMVRTGTLDERVRATIDSWLAYVEQHPYAGRLLFRDTTGDPALVEVHRQMQAAAREATMSVLSAEGELALTGEEIEPTAELIRAGMAGLALWWSDHPEVPRQVLVDVAARAFVPGSP